jgi:hypothetical protein
MGLESAPVEIPSHTTKIINKKGLGTGIPSGLLRRRGCLTLCLVVVAVVVAVVALERTPLV